jgi:hypothetical protein
MKTPEEIKAKLEEIASDERLSYPPALVFSNAPLALIQTDLCASVEILQWVLDIPKEERKKLCPK